MGHTSAAFPVTYYLLQIITIHRHEKFSHAECLLGYIYMTNTASVGTIRRGQFKRREDVSHSSHFYGLSQYH